MLPEMEDGDESIIIDNGSQSPLAFAHLHPRQNLGFSGGSNLGLAAAAADVVLFLNNDIALGERGWLQDIRSHVEPGVLVGPLRNGIHTVVDGRPYPYLDGWCLAGMREDLQRLGGFDQNLMEPAYYSDNLLCLEARAAGMTLRHVQPRIQHKLNRTAGPAADELVRKATLVNRERYIARVRELAS